MVDSSSGEAGEPDGGHIKAETLVGLSRDVGLARQDTSVAFVRQSHPIHISSFFYLTFIFICTSCSSHHSLVVHRVVQPVCVV